MPFYDSITLQGITGNAEIAFSIDQTTITTRQVKAFDREKFLEYLCDNHPSTTTLQVVTLILDASRCIFSPDPKNWPGATIVLTEAGHTMTVKLEQGKTLLENFQRNSRGTWSWTHCCLAFCGVYKEVWLTTSSGTCAAIPGNVNGLTSMCTTLEGFSLAEYDACMAAMANWVRAQGQTPIDAIKAANIRRAVEETIKTRNLNNHRALSFRQLIKLLTGGTLDTDTASCVTK